MKFHKDLTLEIMNQIEAKWLNNKKSFYSVENRKN